MGGVCVGKGPAIDEKIDYQSFYLHYLPDGKVSAGRIVSRCPVHKDGDEANASFSVSLKDGRYKCHGCEETGNVYTFLAWAQGMSKEDAKKTVHKAAGVVSMQSRDASKKPSLTLDQYADEKNISVDFLKALGLKDARGKTHIVIPYLNENGETVCTRRRHPKGAQARFTWVAGSAGKIIPYGAWKLRDIAGQDLILVEGESDCHALWANGVHNAIGVPGADMTRAEWIAAYMMSAPALYVHVEPGESGERMLRKVCASAIDARYLGKIFAFSTRGAKDPSELLVDDRDTFKEKWAASVESANEVAPADYAIQQPREMLLLPGAPLSLRMPEAWMVSPHGGVRMQVQAKSGEIAEVTACPVPLLLSKRLRNIDTSEEKVELAYMRDGAWHNVTAKRSTVFTSRGIVDLADRGLPVSSERAKMIVKYLDDLEAENLDTLPVVRSTERLGWVDSKRFLPGLCDDVYLDPPEGSEHLANAYHEQGTIEEWKAAAEPVREAFPLARFMLAASFAAPMLRMLQQRVFIIHYWGSSRGGKTAALKLALSAWGNPDSLMATFNSTKVGMERMAGFYNDLPLGVDERQVIGRDQNFAESLVYMLGAGKGKVRGAKKGGLQQTHEWRTIAITTGEEPLSRSNTHTGVKTRALEIYGKPVGREEVARSLHATLDSSYGHAGPEFVRRLVAARGAGLEVEADYAQMMEVCTKLGEDHMMSHVSAVATIALADSYISEWLYGQPQSAAWADAVDMASTIIGGLETASEADYTVRAIEWIEDWLAVNRDRFTSDDCKEPWGYVEDQHTYWITPSRLDEALAEAGFAASRVLKDLERSDRLVTYREYSGRVRRSKRVTWQGQRIRMIGFLSNLEGKMGPQGSIFGG